jgi:hypothetical protein
MEEKKRVKESSEMGKRSNSSTLTGHSLNPPGQRGLVAANALTQGLVPGADGDDGDQRDDEAQSGRDAPLAEDNAEIGRVPCEEHLRGCEFGRVKGLVVRGLTFMLHMGPLSPWPACDEWSIMW